VNYYSLPSENSGSGIWQETWNNATNIPGSLTLELLFEGDNKQFIKIKRTVMIPAAAAPVAEQLQQQQKRTVSVSGK